MRLRTLVVLGMAAGLSTGPAAAASYTVMFERNTDVSANELAFRTYATFGDMAANLPSGGDQFSPINIGAGFDTSGLTGTITAATVRYFLPEDTFFSWTGSETFRVYDVTTSASALSAFNIGATSIYNDLGSGTLFGSTTITASLEGGYVDVALNSNFLSYINGSAPDIFSLGGALTSAIFGESAYIFSGTGDPTDGRTQLLLWGASPAQGNVAVPEPSTYGLIGAAALLAGIAYRRRKAARKA